MTNNDASILPDRKRGKNRLGASEHRLGIGTEEEQAGFLRALPASVIAVVAGSVAELSQHIIEIEIRVDVVGKGDPIEEDRQTLRRAELSQHLALMQNFGTGGRTCLLERRNSECERVIEIRELDLDISEINFTGLAQLGAAARNTTEVRLLENGVKRVFVSLTSIHGFEMFVQARDDQMWAGHRVEE